LGLRAEEMALVFLRRKRIARDWERNEVFDLNHSFITFFLFCVFFCLACLLVLFFFFDWCVLGGVFFFFFFF